MKLVSEQPPTTPELVGYLRHTPACVPPTGRDTVRPPEVLEHDSGIVAVSCPECGAHFPDHALPAGPEASWDPVIQWHRQIEQRRHEEEQHDQRAASRAKTGAAKR